MVRISVICSCRVFFNVFIVKFMSLNLLTFMNYDEQIIITIIIIITISKYYCYFSADNNCYYL